MRDQDFDRATRFLDALVADVQRYGVSSSAMQSMLVEVARGLNLQGQFLATPTQVQSIIWDEDEDRQRLHISVSNTGDYDLTKLAPISELVESVKSGAVSPDDGLDRLRATVPSFNDDFYCLFAWLQLLDIDSLTDN